MVDRHPNWSTELVTNFDLWESSHEKWKMRVQRPGRKRSKSSAAFFLPADYMKYQVQDKFVLKYNLADDSCNSTCETCKALNDAHAQVTTEFGKLIKLRKLHAFMKEELGRFWASIEVSSDDDQAIFRSRAANVAAAAQALRVSWQTLLLVCYELIVMIWAIVVKLWLWWIKVSSALQKWHGIWSKFTQCWEKTYKVDL